MKRTTEAKIYRIERKFVIDGGSIDETLLLIKNHPAVFNEQHQSRHVNNIYLDSNSLDSFNDSIQGNPQRAKYRIRWYGNFFGKIINANFEIKVKEGLAGRKITYKLPTFIFNNNFNLNNITNIIEKSNIPANFKLNIQTFKPVLINRYLRSYYQSANKKFRITLDSNLDYFDTYIKRQPYLSMTQQFNNIILEIKYSPLNENMADFIANYFPLRISKNSKYVNGIEILNL